MINCRLIPYWLSLKLREKIYIVKYRIKKEIRIVITALHNRFIADLPSRDIAWREFLPIVHAWAALSIFLVEQYSGYSEATCNIYMGHWGRDRLLSKVDCRHHCLLFVLGSAHCGDVRIRRRRDDLV